MTLTVTLVPLALVVAVLVLALATAVRQRRARDRAPDAGAGRPAPAAPAVGRSGCARAGEAVVVLGADGHAYEAWLTGLRASQAGALPLVHELRPRPDDAFDGASTDEIMAIPNRRRFLDLVRRELIRASRYARSLGLLAMRIDRFDAIVASHGPEVGDAVLRAVAATVVADLRASDSLGRLGDDAFGICLPETDLAGAAVVAERVVAEVRAIEVPAGGAVVAVTVSVAACSVGPADLHDLDPLLAAADAALDRARLAGGDRVAAAHVAGVFGPPVSSRGG